MVLQIEAYAAYSKDVETVINSSSGGVFTELAKSILYENGFVFGVAFDEKYHAKHICVDNIADLSKLRGSKYLQSHINNCYNEAITLSKTNKVLFSGTPCQIAALNNLASNKDNIITCEIICHGVPSEKVFDSYINMVANGKEIENINFRSKKISWERFGIKIKFKDNTEYFKTYDEDPFVIGFLQNVYLRESCYNCKYATIPRQADITIGDYWGVPDEIKNTNGTSVVFCNTQKGHDFFVNTKNLIIKSTTFKQAVERNPRMISGTIIKDKSNEFYLDFHNRDFKYVIKKYLLPIRKRSFVNRIKHAIKKILKICRVELKQM